MRSILFPALLTSFLAAATPVEIVARDTLANTRGIKITGVKVSGDSVCSGGRYDIGGDGDSVTVGFDAFQSAGGLVQCNVNVQFTYTPTSSTTSFTAQVNQHGFAGVKSGGSVTFGHAYYSTKAEKKFGAGDNQQVDIQTTGSAIFDGKGNGQVAILAYVSTVNDGYSIGENIDVNVFLK